MSIRDDMAVDLAANHYDADQNPYAYAATFYPKTGASVSLTVNMIMEDSIELDGYAAEVQGEETTIEYQKVDINRDVLDGERFEIAGRAWVVKGIRSRNRFSIKAIVK